jgi:hypothetical protein
MVLASLQPGDVLPVEGGSRLSTAIKYLTQSARRMPASNSGDPTRAICPTLVVQAFEAGR